MARPWYEATDEPYDRITQRLARRSPEEVERLRAKPEGPDPEARFTDLVGGYLRSADVVLDVGTGDGEWLMTQVAPRVRHALGVDVAGRRLWQALQLRAALGSRNVSLLLADARRLPLADDAVDVVISRRGPLTADERSFAEGCRLLRRKGLILEITIGEQDGQEVYEVFGRGQMYGERERGPRLDRLVAMYRAHGLVLMEAESVVTSVYLPGREALTFTLEVTPMVEDYDSERDAALVEGVLARHSTARGIHVTMHRLILVARKKGA
jgi:protein-L-isoaspartate O-methyltransferase